MVPFSWELKSQQRSEKIWALHTVNIRTKLRKPENILQMHGKMNTIWGEKSLQCMGIEHHSTVLNMRLSPLGYWVCNWSCSFFYPSGYASCQKVEKIQTEVRIFRFVQWWIITPISCNIWEKYIHFQTILQLKIRMGIYFYTVLKYYTFLYFSTTFCGNFPEAQFSW